MSYIVKTNNLGKVIKKKSILTEVNLHVIQGEIYSLISQNKAGITSLFKLLTGLWKPTSGEVELFGERINRNAYLFLQKVGSMIDTPIFYENKTGFENLKMHCEYRGVYDQQHIAEAIELFDLKGMEDKPVHTYPFGLKQKLGIIRAITLKPELLIIDEPMNGLDPLEKRTLRNLIKYVNDYYNATVIISSHHLEELEQITDKVGVIQNGRLMKEETMDHIRTTFSKSIDFSISDCKKTAYLLEEQLQILHYQVLASGIIRIFDPSVPSHKIVNMLVKNNIQVHEVIQNQHSLENYIFNLSKGSGEFASMDGNRHQ
ncbi:ABC transporter ATP-binding protein [Bacillus carboniphilus]|uniref:ABC transporter ATP-binding protein n=1 Tax=Bacillus carboniphilus TaxID=86663 RepID=A0ABY9JVI5_9BACI|nr:ABC transporter ATP-binding protein [Bacillus carboniphilus]WLR43416.1 ABC transporter ATP-binding protein [Bacillus carboniphilus]